MDSTNKNEMEQIQRGLEAFLEKEMDSAKNPQESRRKNGQGAGCAKEPMELDIIGQSRDREQARRRWQPDGEDAYQAGERMDEAPYQGRRSRGGGYADRYDRQGYDDEAYINNQDREDYYQDDWDADDEDLYRDDWDNEAEDTYRARRRYEEEPHRRRRQYEEEEPYRSRHPEEASSRKRKAAYEEEPSGKRRPQKRGKSREAEPPQEEDSQMSKKKKPKASKKKPRRKKHRLLKFLIGVAVLLVLLGFGLYQLVGVVYGKMNYKEIATYTPLPMSEDGVVNILLIGNDSRQNDEDGRSDAMILLSISSKTKKIYMTSLLRDMYVKIPGHDDNRLNAAYSFGGAELLMETVQLNFDIPVNRYMLVNFGAFVNLVDAVDGIDLELTNDEVIWINNYLVEYNILTENPQGTFELDPSSEGMVHLNGPQALAYSRNRYLGTDFGRTERQRKILTEVIKKMPSALLTNAGGLIDGLMPNLTTNLTRGECFRLSLTAGKLITYEIVSDSIPQPGTYSNATIRKMAVLEVDFEENIRYLKEKLYGE